MSIYRDYSLKRNKICLPLLCGCALVTGWDGVHVGPIPLEEADTGVFCSLATGDQLHILLLWRGTKTTQVSSGPGGISMKASLRKDQREYSWESWLFAQPESWLGPMGVVSSVGPAGAPQCCQEPYPGSRSKEKTSLHCSSLCPFVAHHHSNIFI